MGFTKRALFRPAVAWAIVVLGPAACADRASEDASARGTSPDDAVPDGGVAVDAPPEVGGGELPPTNVPCMPVGRDLATPPTPGRCERGVAEICDPITATLRREQCGPSSECKAFELEERKLDPSGPRVWRASRKIPWAACVPKTALPCELTFDEGFRPTTTPAFSCDGDAQVRCDIPNLPPYPTVTKEGWPIVLGSPKGYRLPKPCPVGETCRVATSEDRTACFPKTAAPCDPAGFALRCEGGEIVSCDPAFSYERTSCCGAGRTCQSSCGSSVACSRVGAGSCDPETAMAACSTTTTRTWCEPGTCRSESETCASVAVVTPSGIENVPGRCAIVAGAPRCIRATDVVCEAATFLDRCDATSAVRCADGLERSFDCAAVGQICGVAGGRAGCHAPAAPSCAGEKRCEGNVVVHCCPPTGISPIMQTNTPCVPGREVRFDCSSVALSCNTIGTLIAECVR